MKATHGGGRPRAYIGTDGRRLPSVSTVLTRFRDGGGLVGFAIKHGWQAEQIADEAGGVGHAVHHCIAQVIVDPHFDTSAWLMQWEHEQQEKRGEVSGATMGAEAEQAFRCWLKWRATVGSEWTFEQVETPTLHRFKHPTRGIIETGATPDAVGVRWDGLRASFDWKTGRKLHPENMIQGGAYANAEGVNVDEHRVVHVPRTGGPPSELVLAGARLDSAHEVFRHLRWAYDAVHDLTRFHGTFFQ